LNNQVRKDFNVEKTSPKTVGVKTATTTSQQRLATTASNNSLQQQLATTACNNSLQRLGPRSTEVVPNKITNHDKHKII